MLGLLQHVAELLRSLRVFDSAYFGFCSDKHLEIATNSWVWFQWWGEQVWHFLQCLLQHAKDQQLESPVGFHNSELYGWTGGTKFSCGFTTHTGPHPGFLKGRSPRYWVCAHGTCCQATVSDVCCLSCWLAPVISVTFAVSLDTVFSRLSATSDVI